MGRFDRGDRPMYPATCSECGNSCKLPFKPSNDKPVFCSDCFSKKEDSGTNRFDRRPARSSFGEKKMFKAVCDTCHKNCEVPFSPSSDKPIYCSDCFEKVEKNNGRNNSGGSNQNNKQFEMLNNKLDEILGLLLPKAPAKKEKPAVKEVVEKKAEVKKVVAKKKVAAPKKVVKKKAPAKKKK